MSRYFRRDRQASTEEIIAAILDIEERLDELEQGNLPCVGRGDEVKGEVLRSGVSKLQ